MKLFESHFWDHTFSGDSENFGTAMAFTVIVGIFVVLAIVGVLMAVGVESPSTIGPQPLIMPFP